MRSCGVSFSFLLLFQRNKIRILHKLLNNVYSNHIDKDEITGRVHFCVACTTHVTCYTLVVLPFLIDKEIGFQLGRIFSDLHRE